MFVLAIGYGQTDVQKAKVLIDNLNVSYAKEKSFEFDMIQRLYTFPSDARPKETFSGHIKKSGDQYRSFTLGVLTIQNKEAKLVIDTAAHTMIYTNPTIMDAYSGANLNAMLSLCTRVTVMQSDTNDMLKLEFNTLNSPVEKMEITLRKSRLIKLVLYHLPVMDENDQMIKPKTEILFQNFNIEESATKADFDLSPYVRMKNNQIQLTDSYSNYSFNNLFIKK